MHQQFQYNEYEHFLLISVFIYPKLFELLLTILFKVACVGAPVSIVNILAPPYNAALLKFTAAYTFLAEASP